MADRRKYLRQPLNPNGGLKARIVLTGESLLTSSKLQMIEIDAAPVNISQGGICISLPFDCPWEPIANKKEIEVILEKEAEERPMKGKVVHVEGGHQTLGVQFSSPLPDLSPFLIPRELHV